MRQGARLKESLTSARRIWSSRRWRAALPRRERRRAKERSWPFEAQRQRQDGAAAHAGGAWPTGGTLRVGGFDPPRQRANVQRRGLGLFAGLNDPQESLTVAYAAGAEFELHGRKPRREAVLGYLREWACRTLRACG
ncbi:MAG: hypothetical protein ACLSVD_18730 [Eggerthellaceae bacterium]